MDLTAISAPGKVLLAGGYLVVDRAYTGLVFGLSARIHVLVKPLPLPQTLSRDVHINHILVRSPQFTDAEWRYGFKALDDDAGVDIVALKGDSDSDAPRNKFVETALAYVLSYIIARPSSHIAPVAIIILADDDYYSQSETSSRCSDNESSQFQNFNVTLGEVHKTGLGSSAALVTAITAAMLAHYIPESYGGIRSDAWKNRVHNLAQAAHSTAQGKVGSGFDVAAAVFGSCIYKRFTPEILEALGSLGTKGFTKRLQRTVDDDVAEIRWDAQIKASSARMPAGLRLVMCDVDCGSETPSMVRKVFAWRRDNPDEALLLWETLQRGNEDLAAELERLSVDSGTVSSFQDLATTILTIRSLVREMSNKANVPIEPQVQTELLDACTRVPGVVGGVVPGAGGFDALALLIEDREEAFKNLSSFLDGYKATSLVGGGPRIGKARLLGAKQEMRGLVSESQAVYKGWI